MLSNPREYKRMAAVEENHWWYRMLHEKTLLALPLLRGSTQPRSGLGEGVKFSILDAGCGTGGLLLKLKALGFTNILGADLSGTAIGICKQRGLSVVQSDVRELPEKLSGESFDAIICNDVLCYFTLDEIPQIVVGFKSLLKPGGLLIMNNPAHKAFSGSHDAAVGIITRFKPTELKALLDNCKLIIDNCTQWPFLLSPIIYLVRKFQKKKESDIDMPPRWLNSLLYSICKLEMKLFKYTPWGSSVFVVCKKHNE